MLVFLHDVWGEGGIHRIHSEQLVGYFIAHPLYTWPTVRLNLDWCCVLPATPLPIVLFNELLMSVVPCFEWALLSLESRWNQSSMSSMSSVVSRLYKGSTQARDFLTCIR